MTLVSSRPSEWASSTQRHSTRVPPTCSALVVLEDLGLDPTKVEVQFEDLRDGSFHNADEASQCERAVKRRVAYRRSPGITASKLAGPAVCTSCTWDRFSLRASGAADWRNSQDLAGTLDLLAGEVASLEQAQRVTRVLDSLVTLSPAGAYQRVMSARTRLVNALAGPLLPELVEQCVDAEVLAFMHQAETYCVDASDEVPEALAAAEEALRADLRQGWVLLGSTEPLDTGFLDTSVVSPLELYLKTSLKSSSGGWFGVVPRALALHLRRTTSRAPHAQYLRLDEPLEPAVLEAAVALFDPYGTPEVRDLRTLLEVCRAL